MHAFNEWLKLVLRWSHVFAGILWVGTTYYFTWLDGRFTELEQKLKEAGSAGAPPDNRVWMVHSGGFYLVEKQRSPKFVPEKLHWFRWEAAWTWITGVLLFMMVYYHGGLMTEFGESGLSPGAAAGLSFALMLVAWPVYDLLANSKPFANQKTGAVIGYILSVVTTWGLFRVFPARAACLQLGAMYGTIMTANVWMRILPAQRRMVAALKQGQEPSQVEAARAKMRSKHNTFIVVPVLFLMLSYHFPETYHWVTVSLLILVGWIAASFLRRA